MSLRIVRLANFVTPVSGGLRTALHHLGAGYLEAGHRPVLLVPGSPGPRPTGATGPVPAPSSTAGTGPSPGSSRPTGYRSPSEE